MRKPGRDYEALIADLKKSGLSLRAFAEEEYVPPSTLARWRRRLSKEAPEAKPATRFLPVKVRASLSVVRTGAVSVVRTGGPSRS